MTAAPAITTAIEFHPVAAIFPMMDAHEFRELVTDIRANGLRQPIITHENQIIDGRNRYLACMECGAEPWFEEWDGRGDLTAFVVSLNLKRRHLSESQRAMVAAKLATLQHGQKKSDMPIGISRPEAAAMLNIGERSVARASMGFVDWLIKKWKGSSKAA